MDFLTAEDGTNRFFRNLRDELPLLTTKYPSREQISDIVQLNIHLEMHKKTSTFLNISLNILDIHAVRNFQVFWYYFPVARLF